MDSRKLGFLPFCPQPYQKRSVIEIACAAQACRVLAAGTESSSAEREELSDLKLDHISCTSELDELRIAYIRQERNSLAGLLDLLESSPRCTKDDQQTIARVRGQLAKIGTLLAAVGLEPSVTRH
jgi:hypothetical protein